MTEIPPEIVRHIATNLPPGTTLVNLLRLSHATYDLVLPLVWTSIEIDDRQLLQLLLAYHNDVLDACPNPENAMSPSTARIDRLRSNDTSIIPSPRAPLRNPWKLIRAITLWWAPSIRTANLILPFLHQHPHLALFPNLQTLRLPFRVLESLCENSYSHAYDLKKRNRKFRQSLTRIFRPSEVIILGTAHFPGESQEEKRGLDPGPILWDWISNLSNDWLSVRKVTWDGIGFHQLCLISGIPNTIIMAPGELSAAGDRNPLRVWKMRLDGVLRLTWSWEIQNHKVGSTKVVWRGPDPPRTEVEGLERWIAGSRALLDSPLRAEYIMTVDGIAKLKCFEYDDALPSRMHHSL